MFRRNEKLISFKIQNSFFFFLGGFGRIGFDSHSPFVVKERRGKSEGMARKGNPISYSLFLIL